ncbi:MAG: hypothetical protein AYK18_01340, partial [Theionarchaea archaeon DG-70]
MNMKTVAEGIVSQHMKTPVKAGQEIEELPIDKLLINDVAAVQLIELYKTVEDLNPKPFDPSSVFVVLDHVTPPPDPVIAENLSITKQFAKALNLRLFKEGEGIEHVLLTENNLINPHEILLGTDSHTCTNGAIGCFAFGIGITDALFVLCTGTFYNFTVPETILIKCTGSMKKGVYAKDLILCILSQLNQRNVLDKVICNMATEISAKTGIISLKEDLSAEYADHYTFPVDDLTPYVAVPHSPLNGKPISEVNTEITKAFLGSCTNSRLTDLQIAAQILE